MNRHGNCCDTAPLKEVLNKIRVDEVDHERSRTLEQAFAGIYPDIPHVKLHPKFASEYGTLNRVRLKNSERAGGHSTGFVPSVSLVDRRFVFRDRNVFVKRTSKLQGGCNVMSDMIFAPGPTENSVRTADGLILTAPDGWCLVPPGDAALTRRVKAAGDHWIVQEKKGRKVFSRGVWAPTETVERLRKELAAERSSEGYAKRKAAETKRRETAQAEYVEDFFGAVVTFLNFHTQHSEIGERLARAVTDHTTPVGSGTVARTKRIPVAQRAEAAVIAWMRHQTTGYDDMVIPRVKGKRREVRRILARRSHELLEAYRQGRSIPADCPLQRAFIELNKYNGRGDNIEDAR